MNKLESLLLLFTYCYWFIIPWRRKWLSTTVFLLGELHGQRSLAGYRT